MSHAQGELFAEALALPAGFTYQPDFLSAEEESRLLAHIAGLPLEQARYREYTARRRVAYFGFGYDFSSNRLDEAPPVPAFLAPLREKVARWMGLAASELAHALVTEYRPGTPLGWHRDAPDFDRVAGVSLGGWARMRLRPYRAPSPIRVLELAPRSAYRMEGEARWRWQHSVPATRELRYSITFRSLIRKD